MTYLSLSLEQIQSTLEYLCNSSESMMSSVVSRLADQTTTAGMELLRFA